MPNLAMQAPECNALDAIAAAECGILLAEGLHYVAGRYIASAADATRARRLEAERCVAAAERLAAWLAAHPCRWCGAPVQPGERFDLIAHEPVHTVRCARELEAMLYPAAEPVPAPAPRPIAWGALQGTLQGAA